MPASKPEGKLRQLAAQLIVKRCNTMGVAAVAKSLKISRQAVYDIKKGKYCPSLALVKKACDEWNERFELPGMIIDGTNIRLKDDQKENSIEASGDLFQGMEIDNQNLEVVQAKPLGRALEITLRITLPDRKVAGGN